MNKKLIKEYLIITLIIMLISWGACIVITKNTDLTIENIFLRILFVLGGFSPTIASFISLKRNDLVKNFEEWIKKVFDIRHGIYIYLIMLLFILIYYVLGCTINGFKTGYPIYLIFIITPICFFSGGNEEAGWRMILQPELEKKYNIYLSSVITGCIWWLWHLPLFFIKGTSNYTLNYFQFGIMIFTLSFAFATIRKISKGVFPCVLAHSLINALSAILVFNFSWTSCIATLILTIIASAIILQINNKKELDKCNN